MFKKKCLFGGGLGLGSSIAIFASISSDVIATEGDITTKPKNSIHDFRSELNQIAWDRACSEEEFDIKSNNEKKYSWILNDKYKDSRTKVIGKAIGDCVAGEGAFAKKPPEDIITFERTNPETYGPENWNAVILYNYVHEAINGTAFGEYDKAFDEKIDDVNDLPGFFLKMVECAEQMSDVRKVLENKLKTIEEFYKNEYSLKNIDLTKAVQDIQQYVSALGLAATLRDFRNQKRQYDRNKSPDKLTIDLKWGFNERGEALSKPFFCLNKKNASNKRLSYEPNFRYHNGHLYISGLDIATENFIQETNEWKADSYLVFITEWSKFSEIQDASTKSEFRWLTDRLKGLVEMPSEEVWNKWQKEIK